ncbi:uncharacterized protein LOC113324665 [Papaver somniferum]|uniref:uncharacterized protein LOC113324665 n=1 Tax=Papaver somniferum TaxID=3469 RepID=UPI000E6FBECF|nr:uncharacterized protein LOC113324665 [Papaver somniferum]
MRVNNLIKDNTCTIPEEMLKYINTEDLPILSLEEAKLIWTAIQSREFTIQSAINVIREIYPKMRWFKRLWKSYVHPSTAGNVWKITRNACNTDENVKKRGISLASRCYLCHKDQDLLIHILWNCNYGQLLWSSIGGIFAFKNPKSFDDIMTLCKNSSSWIQELWLIASSNMMVEIWFSKNHVLKAFDIKCRKVKSVRAIECSFLLPKDGEILLCCDGASRGNPGCAGYGFIARDSIGNLVTAESGGMGITTNFVAEIIGTISSMEWVVQNNQDKLIVNSDSHLP